MNPALFLASIIQRWPMAVIGVTLSAALALSFGLPRLEFRTGQDTLLDPGSKISRDNVRYQREFGGDPMLILFETPPGGSIQQLFTTANRQRLDELTRSLEDSGDYESVITPLLILDLAQTQVRERMVQQPIKLAEDQDRAAAEARAEAASRGASPEEQERAAADARQRVVDEFNRQFGADARRFVEVGDQSLDNPRFVEFVLFDAEGKIRPELTGVFPDERHALMIVRLAGNLSIDDSSSAAASVVDEAERYQFDGVDTLTSGSPLLVKEINDEMRDSLLVMAMFAVAIMTVVLFLVFRARWRLLSLPAVLIGCVAAFGLMGFVGIPLTMVTISGLPILIGLGVDFAIQVHSRLEEETLAADSAEIGIERMAQKLGPALILAVIAACVGFLVLHLSEVPMVRDFGSMLAVGAVIVFMMSMALIASIVFLRERVRLGPHPSVRARIEVERMVGGITSRAVGRLLPIAIIALLIALVGFWASDRIETETDPEKFVPSNSSVLTDLHYIRDVTGSTSELNLLVEAQGDKLVTDEEVLVWLWQFERRMLDRHPELRRSNSLGSLTASLTGGAPTADAAERALDTLPSALIDSVVSADRKMASITFAISGDDSLAERKALTNAVESDANATAPEGVTAARAGIVVIGTATVDAVSSNRDLMSFVAIAAIVLVLLVVYRNPVKAIAPLLPVVLALGASATMIYAAGIKYSPLTSISGPLIIAMGTEFSVLLMARYFEERASGAEPREAMSRASLRIGRAITASGLTVMGGFGVLAFTNFPLLNNFGSVTALNIGLSLVSTLILLPPLLVWADGDRHFVGAPSDVVTEQ